MKREELADYLNSRKSYIQTLNAVTGLDGFVDEMITVVDERSDLDSFRRVEDISRFSELIKDAAGHSSLREIVVTATHPGGCAVNIGDGMASMGVTVDTFATLGNPLHPAFAEYGKKARIHSWGSEPGRTLAFEFADGKLMFSAMTQLTEIRPEEVAKHLDRGIFSEACKAASLIALTNWTLYPHMTGVWKQLNDRVFSGLEDSPWLFIDLVDPSSRCDSDIQNMLNALRGFSANMRVVLGLNQNEANILSRILNVDTNSENQKAGSSLQAENIRMALGLEQVVVHAHAYACCSYPGGSIAVDGPYCPNPRKSTGAGDRFNAGFALGLMLDLLPEECLTLAVSSSGFFVRNAHSASLEDLATFLRDWSSSELNSAG